MPRSARKNLDGRYFHVMVQGIGKEHIFPDDESKGFYINCLKNAKDKHPSVKLLGFCVMGNHAHMLFVLKEDSSALSMYLRSVNSIYASYYNRRLGRVGYVFRDRFKSQVILSESHLAYCLAYIHNNPLKAGLAERAEDYSYSSLSNYLLGTGIVDFKTAKRHYDISPANIMAIMAEATPYEWIEHDADKKYENPEAVLKELFKKYGLKHGKKVNDIEVAALITRAMQQRCGVSVKFMADLLGFGRETLRKSVVITAEE